jgi:hypothetical protein
MNKAQLWFDEWKQSRLSCVVSEPLDRAVEKSAVSRTHHLWMLRGGIPERTPPQLDHSLRRLRPLVSLLGFETQPLEDAEQRIRVVSSVIRLVGERVRPPLAGVTSTRTPAIRIVRERIDQHTVQLTQCILGVRVWHRTEEHPRASALPSPLHHSLNQARVFELFEVESRGRHVDAEPFSDRRRVKRIRRLPKHAEHASSGARGESALALLCVQLRRHGLRVAVSL